MLGFLKRKRKIHREATALKRIPTIPCDVQHLCPADEVDLDEIFHSELIEAAWNAALPEIRALAIPNAIGGVNPGDGRAIFYLLSYFQPRSVLEVGTHIGASTVHMAAAFLNHQKSEGNPHLLSVDARNVNDPVTRPWAQLGATLSPAEMVYRLGCDQLVEFATGTSPEFLNRCTRGADFVFLDDDHAAETVYREIPAALKLLSKGGLILLHDYFPGAKPLWSDRAMIPGPFLATERLMEEGAQFEVLHLGRLPWPTKLGSYVTSLALLVRKS